MKDLYDEDGKKMHKMERLTKVSHIEYLDNMRVFAAFAVVVLHVSAQNWYSTDISSLAWAAFNVYSSAVRWAVPVFVMVSGVVFLNKSIPVKLIFTKYIFRLLVGYVFWSFVYAVFEGGDVKTILINVLSGYYHMWYIPMLIGLYLCIPMYKKIVESDGIIRYFLGISFFVSFLIPHMVLLVKDFGPVIMNAFVDLMEPHWDNVKLSMVLGYSAYYILGYYLDKIELSRRKRFVIYILGVASYFATVFTTHIASQAASSPNGHYYTEFTLNTLAQSIAIFVFFKYHGHFRPLPQKVCAVISRASFGIYWVHVLAINLIDKKMMLNTLSFFPAISVPAISIVVFVLSFVLSWTIGKIPLIRRYVV